MIIAQQGLVLPDVGDANWTSVKLLMGFEGANNAIGAPGMNDESASAHGTATGGNSSTCFISTTTDAFGGSSLQGNGGSLTFANSADWALSNGHFTLEAWIAPYLAAQSSLQFILALFGASTPNLGWVLYLDTAGKLNWNSSTTGTDNNHDITSSVALSAGNYIWQHVALDFDGSKYRMYLNGLNVGSFATPRTLHNPSTQPLAIGSNSGINGFFFFGYMDEVRITKGVARYATDTSFSVPTRAFPRHA